MHLYSITVIVAVLSFIVGPIGINSEEIADSTSNSPTDSSIKGAASASEGRGFDSSSSSSPSASLQPSSAHIDDDVMRRTVGLVNLSDIVLGVGSILGIPGLGIAAPILGPIIDDVGGFIGGIFGSGGNNTEPEKAEEPARCDCGNVLWKPCVAANDDKQKQLMNMSVAAGDNIPGASGGAVFVGRVKYERAIRAGKYVQALNATVVHHSGSSNAQGGVQAGPQDGCEILTDEKHISRWVPVPKKFHAIPRGAVLAGYEEETLVEAFVCRAKFDGVWVPGRLDGSTRKCYVEAFGWEYSHFDFEILLVY